MTHWNSHGMLHTWTRACLREQFGSQNFQGISDVIHFELCQHGFKVVNYIDYLWGVGTLEVAQRSFDNLCDLLQHLGLTISKKKLISPCTDVVCLGVHINTEKGTISIPDEKVSQIKQNVTNWLAKTGCTKHQLQSLNRVLGLLLRNHDQKHLSITQSFRCDVRWFDSFLSRYNGISMYHHRRVDYQVALNACLEGFGGVWNNFVYHRSIPRHYLNLGMVQLEMVIILVALRVFGLFWHGRKVMVYCDNKAVVNSYHH